MFVDPESNVATASPEIPVQKPLFQKHLDTTQTAENIGDQRNGGMLYVACCMWPIMIYLTTFCFQFKMLRDKIKYNTHIIACLLLSTWTTF